MSQDPTRALQYGKGGRPTVSNKLGAPAPNEGSDGDMQVRQTVYGPKLYAKIGGRWNNSPLFAEEGEFHLKDKNGKSVIKLSDDYGGSLDVGSYLRITQHIGMIDFAASGSNSSGNIVMGDANHPTGRPLRDLTDTSTNIVNVVMGDVSMLKTKNARDNVAIGTYTMAYAHQEDSGNSDNCSDNVAIGAYALRGVNSTNSWRATKNVAIGYGAIDSHNLSGNNTITDNVAIGNLAGRYMQGNYNIAIGSETLGGATNTAANNVGIGFNAGHDTTSGAGNVYIGYAAGDTNATGANNVFIGTNADCNATNKSNQIAIGTSTLTYHDDSISIGVSSGGTYANTIAIGSSASATNTHAISIGHNVVNGTTNTIKIGQAGDSIQSTSFGTDPPVWSQVSDIRKKRNIQDDNSIVGLEFINKLRHVRYQKKSVTEWPKEWDDYKSVKNSKEGINGYVQDLDRVHYGFIAQEVKQTLDECGLSYLNIWTEYPDGCQALGIGGAVYPLIKAVQEISTKLDTMQTEIDNLKSE